ncbi:MAG: HD domain-containing protein [Bifidobacteriaceae bacterium]|nr:HD domain-containing protein [Bifidobacteriaceae bacterium]
MSENDFFPTVEQAVVLHKHAAPSEAAFELVYAHCNAIALITRLIVRQQNALFMGTQVAYDGICGGMRPSRLLDENLAVVGALLHDIGTYQVLLHDGCDGEPLQFDGPRYIQHGLLGYKFLRENHVEERVALFARNHTGVGLTQKQVISQNLPLPVDDYAPTTLEQEVVMVADKYNSKSIPPRFLTKEAYARKASKFGEDNKQRWLDLVRQYGEINVAVLARQFHMSMEE